MKWVNLQMLRFILPTNYSVSKYNNHQDPRCSFCHNHLELIPDLVWGCRMVSDFWSMVGNILNLYFPNFNLGRKEAIFGDHKSNGNSVINTIIVLSKQFIWTEKFGKKDLNEMHYTLFMRKELKLLLEIMQFKGEMTTLNTDWADILQHFEVEI